MDYITTCGLTSLKMDLSLAEFGPGLDPTRSKIETPEANPTSKSLKISSVIGQNLKNQKRSVFY